MARPMPASPPAVPRSLEDAYLLVRDAASGPVRTLFLARAMRSLAEMATRLDAGALSDAAAAPSDLSVLLGALEKPGMIEPYRQDAPLAAARLRGLRARRELLEAEGGTLGASAVADLLGLSRQAVDKRRQARRLLALSTGRRGYAYPAWQFGEQGVLRGLPEVLAALGDDDPWMKLSFFLQPHAMLDDGGTPTSPLTALRAGQLDAVLRAARAFGRQGAV